MIGNTIECNKLCKRFGGVSAVSDVSISFHTGRITALIGPNGAGKTTLFHLITGALHPDTGKVTYRGHCINGWSAWKTARLGIGRLFQDVRVFQNMTSLENVMTAFHDQSGENPLWSVILPRKVAKEEYLLSTKAASLLNRVGLSDQAETLAGELSFGQQKLLAIARLLAGSSDVLLLDEPTSGVNPAMVHSLISVLKSLAADGKTIVIIEHNMDVVLNLADWVCFMDQGQIVAFGSPADVLDDPSVRRAYLGL